MKWNQFKKSSWMKSFFAGALLALSFGAQADSYDIHFHAEDDGSLQRAIYFTENIENPVKPDAALLFIHGMQSHAEWVQVSGFGDALADQGIDVFAVDRRGSGKSESESGLESPEQVMSDLDQAVEEMEAELFRRYGANHGVKLHIMANCFGARLIVPYLAEMSEEEIKKFDSLTLIAPSTHMSKQASYGFWEGVKMLRTPDDTLHDTPLQDEWFVGEGEGLDYIKSDELALRQVNTRFLKTARTLTKIMNKKITKLPIPLMIMVGSDDVMVENEKVKKRVFLRYHDVRKWVELESPHSLEFGSSKDIFIEESADWISGSGVEFRQSEAERISNRDSGGIDLPSVWLMH